MPLLSFVIIYGAALRLLLRMAPFMATPESSLLDVAAAVFILL